MHFWVEGNKTNFWVYQQIQILLDLCIKNLKEATSKEVNVASLKNYTVSDGTR